MERPSESGQSVQADIWLFCASVIWGASFPLVKIALRDISPFLFLSIRFWIGGVFLLGWLLFQKKLSRGCITRSLFTRGHVLGLFMFIGMLLQTKGLQYTKATNSAFITGMTVIWVPVLVVLLEKRLPRRSAMIGVVLAAAGLYVLTAPQSSGINRGDVFTLIAAVSFAFQIVLIELLIKPGESLMIAVIMILTTAFYATLAALFAEIRFLNPVPAVWAVLIFVALFCTTLGFGIQTTWQPRTSATAAAVIYTTEPVFALIFSRLWLPEERLTRAGLLGGGLIIAGMLVTEIRRRM